MILGQLVVIDAIDHGEVGAVGGGGHQHALGAGVEMGRGLFLGGEDAGAFQGDVDVQFPVRQFGRILDRGDFDLVARRRS